MPAPPSGTVTFLFTDIEGSTALAQRDPEAWAAARDRHDATLRGAIESHGGYVFQVVGDAFCAAFASAEDAILAAVDAQRQLARAGFAPAPASGRPAATLRVRIGIHSGEARLRANGDYDGYVALAHTQRIAGAACGEQVLVSQATAEPALASLPDDVRLRPIGEHRLKGFDAPELLYQCEAEGLRADFPPSTSLVDCPNNLPRSLTSFVGRTAELAELVGMLSAGPSPIVTLTGVGGTGKTRLALEAAKEVLEHFSDGVWLVELASIVDPAQVARAVGVALAVREEPGRQLADALADRLRDRTALLILDNCEHLVAACAELAERLVRQSPAVRILATSREALRVVGEVVWLVPSLTVPPADGDPADVLGSEAGRLFVDRAAAADRAFSVTLGNAAAIVQICRRLDGIPLALELAAARVGGLPVEAVAARLDDRFHLLTGGSRTTLPRQRTLLGAIDWSYTLLSEPERALLRRISVFAGAWTLEATEAVCADGSSEIVDVLSSLVARSLVTLDESVGRYLMLETIRQFADDRLRDAGEDEAYRIRHLAYYADLVDETASKLTGAQATDALAMLDAERDNVRAALGWALARGEPQASIGGRMVQALDEYWTLRGHLGEARDWHRRAVAAVQEEGTLRARLLERYGGYEWMQGDLKEARAHVDEAVRICRSMDVDDEVVADTLHRLGHVLFDQGDYDAARIALADSLALYRRLGEENVVGVLTSDLGLVAYHVGDPEAAEASFREALSMFRRLDSAGYAADTLARLGDVARTRGDTKMARACYDESLTTARQLGLRPEVAQALDRSAYVFLRAGDVAEAQARLVESLAIQREIGNRQGIAECLGALAGAALAVGDADRAARLLGAQAALLERIGVPLSPADRSEVENDTTAARERLGVEAFDTAMRAGGSLTVDQAIDLATGS